MKFNTIDIAIQNRWKLLALDSLESAFIEEGIPFDDRVLFNLTGLNSEF